MDILDQILEASQLDGGSVDRHKLLDKLNGSIKSILLKSHDNPSKHDIQDKGSRLNFACPYCGDSKHNPNKKRGNVYKDGMWYKCYNSPCKTLPIWKMLEDFHEIGNFTDDELIFMKSTADISGTKSKTTTAEVQAANQLAGFIALQQYAFPRSSIMTNMLFKEVTTSDFIMDYLKKRKQIPSIYGDLNHFAYDKHNNALVIMNLDVSRLNVMGLQLRYFNPKNGIRFKSYNYGDLAKFAFSIDKESIKPEILVPANKVSLIYNFWQTDFTSNVLILESGIDSNHFKNSIGILGANNNVKLRKNSYYMYDNSNIDKAGASASADRLDDEYNVFMWTKFINDFPIYRSCKDLNDIMKRRPISRELIMKYFTNDPLDLMEI
jgi:hypothetical protein